MPLQVLRHVCPIVILLCAFVTVSLAAPPEKVKVYILAGQSNMVGYGQLRSLPMLGEDEAYRSWLMKLKNDDGSWRVRDDVTIAWKGKRGGSGPLTVGWGANENFVGPELLFGTVMGEAHEAPVLLIKTAWGGKDVFCDFRSPSAGELSVGEKAFLARESAQGNTRQVGVFYRRMIAEVRESLDNIAQRVPGYAGQGYELAGFVWFQGWNDFCQWHVEIDGVEVGAEITARYAHNVAAMVRDVRKELGCPELPVVIGELGVGGHFAVSDDNPRRAEAKAQRAFRRAQRLAAEQLTDATFVPTAEYWDDRLAELTRLWHQHANHCKLNNVPHDPEQPLATAELSEEYLSRGGHWECHYNGSAQTYSKVGHALATALLKGDPAPKRDND